MVVVVVIVVISIVSYSNGCAVVVFHGGVIGNVIGSGHNNNDTCIILINSGRSLRLNNSRLSLAGFVPRWDIHTWVRATTAIHAGCIHMDVLSHLVVYSGTCFEVCVCMCVYVAMG